MNNIFKDPTPSLSGPPTQTVSGVTNKSAIIDNKNLKVQYDPSDVKTTGSETSTIKPNGIGKDWTPNQYNPQSISGNDTFVYPKTTKTEPTNDVVNNGITKTSETRLKEVQAGLPKPKVPKPVNTPRIKTIKIPRPTDSKDVTDLLNLPKSSLG
jgi:hypothetical protein